jgi:fructokinase
VIAGVETGGTKIVCAVAEASRPHELIDTVEIPTTTPAESGTRVRSFLDRWDAERGIEAVGVASFGPVELDPASPRYRSIVATPKAGWSDTRIVDLIGDGRRFAVVSDVTGSALGEAESGAGRGLTDLAYVTVGTGVGVGAIIHGMPVSATGHPEMGHLMVRRHPSDQFEGSCPFHGDCLEGLASGPAMSARWGRSTKDLGEVAAEAVQIEAHYLGQLLTTIVYALVPQRIVVGGGALKIPGLLDAARAALVREINGALGPEHRSSSPEEFVVRPELGDLAGVTGALALARDLAAGAA